MKNLLNFLIRFNFRSSVAVSIFGGLIAVTAPDLFFHGAVQTNGPVSNNLLIAITYLAIIQLFLLVIRYLKAGYDEAALMGFVFLMLAINTGYYSEVNDLYLDNTISIYGSYIGISHIIYTVLKPKKGMKANSSR